MTSQERAEKTAAAVMDVFLFQDCSGGEPAMVERVAAIVRKALNDHAADIRRQINGKS